MQVEFIGHAKLVLDKEDGKPNSKFNSCFILLDVSKNLNRDSYVKEDGTMTEEGTKALTLAFVSGLAGNIHQAHQNGSWDSAEHLRYIISELERQFIQIAKVTLHKEP